MHSAVLQLRWLAALLAILWAGVGLAYLAAYRPGSPAAALVVIAVLLPAGLAALALRWPPLSEARSGHTAVRWLGIASVLLVAPILGGLLDGLVSGTPGPVVPSLELAYAGLVALAGTCLFTAIGLVRAAMASTAGRRLASGTLLGTALTLLVGGLFAGASLADQEARQVSGADVARLPGCGGPITAARWARVEVVASAVVDGYRVGRANLSGVRSGQDERWEARLDADWGRDSLRFVRSGGQSLAGRAGAPLAPLSVPPPLSAFEPAVVAIALDGGRPEVAEEVGLEVVEGALARHCRAAIDGGTALESFPVLRWLARGEPLTPMSGLASWRGELDYWLFAGGEVGLVDLTVSGMPGELWPRSGLSGTLHLRLTARERDRPLDIPPSAG